MPVQGSIGSLSRISPLCLEMANTKTHNKEIGYNTREID